MQEKKENPQHERIQSIPRAERPRERLFRLGPGALSELELMACLLGRGGPGKPVLVQARELLALGGSLRGLTEWPPDRLVALHGMGRSKAAQVVAAIEVGRRLLAPPAKKQPIHDPLAAGELFQAYFLGKCQEHFVALLLDSRHRLIRLAPIAVGSLSATIVHPRELFRHAVEASAAAVILGHNHPSGDPEPSAADLNLTKHLVESGKLLGIEVLDHLIVGSDGILSLRERGFMDR